MLHKSGNVKDCNNYRTIALISHASKILLIIILNRLKPKVEEELSDRQAGYRKNRGTIDMLFVLQILIEKIRNTDQEMFMIFIDYSKAFDSVIHQPDIPDSFIIHGSKSNNQMEQRELQIF